MWNVPRILGPVLVALFLSACSSFHFDSQEVGLLRDSEQDSLEVELIYRNVWCGDDEDEVRHLEEAMARITAGGRFFLLPPTFWDSDLDQTERKLSEKEERLSAASQPGFDAETCRLLVEEARVGVDWISWSDENLKVVLPATPVTAAHVLGELMALAGDNESWNVFAVVAGMARALTEIEVRDDHVYMQFRPGEGGWLRIEFTGLEWGG